MTNPDNIVETLKAKAMLLIQRERELYSLRLGRERMVAWLQAFQTISEQARPDGGLASCMDWASVMVNELHFQTAAAFAFTPGIPELKLISGQAHSPLPERVEIETASLELFQKRSEGEFDGEGDKATLALADALDLQRLLWFAFPHPNGDQVLLVAGVSKSVAMAQAQRGSEDDFIDFTMLGRHLAVLLSNSALIAELSTARRNLQELFDHMRQAIVAFDQSGAIATTVSRQARSFFEREDFSDVAIRDLLFPGAPSYDVGAAAFDEWVQTAFALSPDQWQLCEQYAPRDVVIQRSDGQPLCLELEFRPLVRNAKTTQLMMLATDVSAKRRLESEVRSHRADYDRRLAAMRRLISGGTQVFLNFVESTRNRIAKCESIVKRYPDVLATDAIDELFRQAHTIRGEARAFDLTELEDAAHGLEEHLDELRDAARGEGYVLSEVCSAKLVDGLEQARRALERGCEVLAAAAPAGALVFDQMTVQRSTVMRLVELVGGRDDEIGPLISELTAVPFGVAASGVMESVPSWALFQGNRVDVVVESRELMIPAELAAVLPGVLTHLVKNAIAHGIEPADERVELGKPASGTIRLCAAKSSAFVRITVEDDGRGLDTRRLQQDATASVSASSASEVVFSPGVSTRRAPDTLAGYGVGLDAVREELSRVGYRATLSYTPGCGTKITVEPGPNSMPRDQV